MKNFNETRFLNLVRWELTTYKKEYRNTFLFGAALLLIMLLLTSGYLHSYNDFEIPLYFTTKAKAMAEAMIILGMVGIASSAFGNMNTNQERLAFLMLPASNKEKYLVRTACRMGIFFVLLVAAIAVATFIFALLCLVRTGSFFWAVPVLGVLQDIIFIDSNFWGCISFILFIIGIWTTYILGSVYFRRRALVFTTLTVVAVELIISMPLGFAGVFLAGWMSEWVDEMAGKNTITIEFFLDPEMVIESIFTIFLIVWNTLNIWISYRLFTRMQVINNRWNNK